MESTGSAQLQSIFHLLQQLLYHYDALHLIAPSDDPQYRAWFAERARNLVFYNQLASLLGPSLLLCGVLCGARLVFVRCTMSLGHRTRRRSNNNTARAARREEESKETEDPCGTPSSGKPPGDLRAPTPGSPAHGANRHGARAAAAAAAAGGGCKDSAPPGADPLDHLRWAESCWTSTGAAGLLLWGWLCVLFWNGGCPRFPSLDTRNCLDGWPMLPMPYPVRLYYCCELAWYLHLLLKHHLGVGLRDGWLMLVHHLTSMYLLLVSYCFSVHRPGVLVLALLNSSTPLLHLSKAAHHTDNRRLALVSFAAFTAVFGLTRLVLFPAVFLPITLSNAPRYIPRLREHFPVTHTLVTSLLAVLAVMQWIWFAAVLRILRHAASGDEARLSVSARAIERRPDRRHDRHGGYQAVASCGPGVIAGSSCPACRAGGHGSGGSGRDGRRDGRRDGARSAGCGACCARGSATCQITSGSTASTKLQEDDLSSRSCWSASRGQSTEASTAAAATVPAATAPPPRCHRGAEDLPMVSSSSTAAGTAPQSPSPPPPLPLLPPPLCPPDLPAHLTGPTHPGPANDRECTYLVERKDGGVSGSGCGCSGVSVGGAGAVVRQRARTRTASGATAASAGGHEAVLLTPAELRCRAVLLSSGGGGGSGGGSGGHEGRSHHGASGAQQACHGMGGLSLSMDGSHGEVAIPSGGRPVGSEAVLADALESP